MLEAVAKNLWLLLTLVIPGLFTYGAWRILLLLEPSIRLEINALNQIDSSAIASASIIIAVALLQQAIAIAIESALALLAKSKKKNGRIFILSSVNDLSLRQRGGLMKVPQEL